MLLNIHFLKYYIYLELEEKIDLTNQRGCLNTGTKIQKADHPGAIFFLYSVYMQRVVLVPSSRILKFLTLGYS